MTFYVTSPNFDVLGVTMNFLLAKKHRENILKRTIPGTHYGCGDQASVEYEVLPTNQHVASIGNGTPDFFILSPMPYPLDHVLSLIPNPDLQQGRRGEEQGLFSFAVIVGEVMRGTDGFSFFQLELETKGEEQGL